MARLFNVTVGTRDPIALGRFWSQALGFEVVSESVDLVRLASGSDVPDVLLLRVDEVSPTSALHLDLAANDPVAEVNRLVALGARAVDIDADGRALTREANEHTWFVLTDPEGNDFCIGSEP
jgi:catechol 2,3-dioxygenase-like lactoylglutathione lyase family enzyme